MYCDIPWVFVYWGLLSSQRRQWKSINPFPFFVTVPAARPEPGPEPGPDMLTFGTHSTLYLGIAFRIYASTVACVMMDSRAKGQSIRRHSNAVFHSLSLVGSVKAAHAFRKQLFWLS